MVYTEEKKLCRGGGFELAKKYFKTKLIAATEKPPQWLLKMIKNVQNGTKKYIFETDQSVIDVLYPPFWY